MTSYKIQLYHNQRPVYSQVSIPIISNYLGFARVAGHCQLRLTPRRGHLVNGCMDFKLGFVTNSFYFGMGLLAGAQADRRVDGQKGFNLLEYSGDYETKKNSTLGRRVAGSLAGC